MASKRNVHLFRRLKFGKSDEISSVLLVDIAISLMHTSENTDCRHNEPEHGVIYICYSAEVYAVLCVDKAIYRNLKQFLDDYMI